MVQFLSSSARRAVRFESVLDGTLELVLGLFHLGWAGSLFLLSVWKDAPAPPVMLVIALALTFAGTRLASHYWKQRITIPRAGYVRRRVGVWRWLLAVVVLIPIANVTANALHRTTGNDARGLGAGM